MGNDATGTRIQGGRKKFFLASNVVSPSVVADTRCQELQRRLLADLRGSGYEVCESAVWRDYGLIFADIESCSYAVALIDAYWTSSTWKMIELFYACGASAENDHRYIPRALPCFVYDESQNKNIAALFGTGKIIRFDGTCDDLLRAIRQTERAARSR